MKYIKLFENWLYEAEEGGKPFDPNNPGATLVVDITQEDLYKDPKVMHIILQSMFNRGAAKKDSPDVPEAIKIIPLYVGWAKHKKPEDAWHMDSNTLKEVYVSGVNGEEYVIREHLSGEDATDATKEYENLMKNKSPIFLLTRNKDNWFEKKGDASWITLKASGEGAGNVLLSSTSVSGNWNIKKPKDFALDSSVWTKQQSSLQGSEISVGDLIMLMPAFVGGGLLNKWNEPKEVTEIAQALGYTIPDNYTPKMGGIKKEEK